ARSPSREAPPAPSPFPFPPPALPGVAGRPTGPSLRASAEAWVEGAPSSHIPGRRAAPTRATRPFASLLDHRRPRIDACRRHRRREIEGDLVDAGALPRARRAAGALLGPRLDDELKLARREIGEPGVGAVAEIRIVRRHVGGARGFLRDSGAED